MASENTAGYDSAKRQKYISIKGDGKRNNDGNGYGLNSPERAGDKGQNCNDNKNNSCQCFGIHIRNTQVDDVFRESHFAAGSLDHKGCKKNGENRKNICKAGKEQFHVPRKGHFFPRKIKNHTGSKSKNNRLHHILCSYCHTDQNTDGDQKIQYISGIGIFGRVINAHSGHGNVNGRGIVHFGMLRCLLFLFQIGIGIFHFSELWHQFAGKQNDNQKCSHGVKHIRKHF